MVTLHRHLQLTDCYDKFTVVLIYIDFIASYRFRDELMMIYSLQFAVSWVLNKGKKERIRATAEGQKKKSARDSYQSQQSKGQDRIVAKRFCFLLDISLWEQQKNKIYIKIK